MTKFKQLIDEEVERAVRAIPTEDLSGVLLGLLEESQSKVLDSLMRDYKMNLNQDNQIPPENWDWFKKMLLTAIEVERFQRFCKEVNCKLYAVMNFTKIKFSLPENLENILKFELKDYYNQIVTDKPEEFIQNFTTLPFEFVSLVVRYITNVLAKDKKELLLPKRPTADSYLELLTKKRRDFIVNINNLSLGKSDTFSLEDAKALLDSKAFFEYNALNVGALEFMIRLISSSKAESKINEMLDMRQINLIKQQIFSLPSYLLFIKKTKDGEQVSYFMKDGTQNEQTELTYDDLVKKVFFPNEFVPHKKKVAAPPVAEPAPEGGEGATSGGEPGVEQPSEEELLNQ